MADLDQFFLILMVATMCFAQNIVNLESQNLQFGPDMPKIDPVPSVPVLGPTVSSKVSSGFFVRQDGQVLMNSQSFNVNNNYRNDFSDLVSKKSDVQDNGLTKLASKMKIKAKSQINAGLIGRFRNRDFVRPMQTPPVDWLGRNNIDSDIWNMENSLDQNRRTEGKKLTLKDQSPIPVVENPSLGTNFKNRQMNDQKVNKWIETRINRNDWLQNTRPVNGWTNPIPSQKQNNFVAQNSPINLLGGNKIPLDFPIRRVMPKNISNPLSLPHISREATGLPRLSNLGRFVFHNGPSRGTDLHSSVRPQAIDFVPVNGQSRSNFAPMNGPSRDSDFLPLNVHSRGSNFVPINEPPSGDNFVPLNVRPSVNMQPRTGPIEPMNVPPRGDNFAFTNVQSGGSNNVQSRRGSFAIPFDGLFTSNNLQNFQDFSDNINDRFINDVQMRQSVIPLSSPPKFQSSNSQFSQQNNPFFSLQLPKSGNDVSNFGQNFLQPPSGSMASFSGLGDSQFQSIFNRASETGVFDPLETFDRSNIWSNLEPFLSRKQVNPGLSSGTFDANQVSSISPSWSLLDLAIILGDSKDPEVVVTKRGSVKPIIRDKAETLIKNRKLYKRLDRLNSLHSRIDFINHFGSEIF